ncbi:bud neck involved protein [Agyrium rufum]|nr:bud neck involved protein [Agyrium rufum]
MAALVQSFPQQSSTVTMLQTRPSSASGHFQTTSQVSSFRSPQLSRNLYNMQAGGTGTTPYRGQTSSTPVTPYSFTSQSTTNVSSGTGNPLRQHPTTPYLRPENRTASAPVVPYVQQPGQGIPVFQPHHRHTATSPAYLPQMAPSLNSVVGQNSAAKDDMNTLPGRAPQNTPRPLSMIELNVPDFQTTSQSSKPSPDRYRRINRKSETGSLTSGGSALPSGSGMATVGHLYTPPANTSSYAHRLEKPISQDDMNINKSSSGDLAKRYRRQSIANIPVTGDTTAATSKQREQAPQLQQTRSYASVAAGIYVPEAPKSNYSSRPSSSHGRNGSNGSDESLGSSRTTTSSRPSSSKRDVSGTMVATANPTALQQGTPILRQEAKLITIPPRASSDANKRLTNPSPLSKPMTMTPESPAVDTIPRLTKANTPTKFEPPVSPKAAAPAAPPSPAAQQLAALSKKDNKKEGKSSRLRRAFSFGSAAELRKASAENSHQQNVSSERAKLRKDQFRDDEEAAEAAIVQKQEAAGLGEGIYSGQGHFFTGSTDNLSISSTASSASIMIRKMGKGMKKSTRSLVGLFRPKSVIGVPAADSAVPEPSFAQVSMVTVEAEREKVNVNVSPHTQVGGGTGFPHLERNSLDAASAASAEGKLSFSDRGSDAGLPRRSIVGGERERSEVLAAVKKGILKRAESGQSSPIQRPIENKPINEYTLPNLPNFADSPVSSAPSTPRDDNTRTKDRPSQPIIEGDDYFMSVARFGNPDSKPGTPKSIAARNISFSPRIQFHDTWPSGEYDRRGEIATCNRLTPMLAQQIKEELNSFKMEMEVHEQSKVYTHFF